MADRDAAVNGRAHDLLPAAGVSAIALATYVATLPPSFGMWDTAELQTVATILGIAHPPGCPAFTLLGYAFVHVVPFGVPAWRVNLMCALCTALSAALAFAAARTLGAGRAAAAIAALAFAFSLVVWRDATRAEVLDVALAFRAAALVAALRFLRFGRRADAVAMAAAGGLACATHELSLFVLPSLALALLVRVAGRRPAALAAAAGAFALGLLPNAYLPLRSAYVDAHGLDPMVALGLPRGLPFWNYGDPSNWPRFVRFVTGADFHVAGGFAGYLDLRRYGDYAVQFGTQIAHGYGYVGTVLALLGIAVIVQKRRPAGLALILAAVLPAPYAVAYPDLQDRERYFLLALWCAAASMAVGFERLAALFDVPPKSVLRAVALGAFAASFATVGSERLNLWAQRGDRAGPDEVAAVRSFTPDDAIVLADWSYATPLAYAIYVDGSLGRRSVVPSSPKQYLTNAARWVRRRPVYFVGFDDDLHLPGWHVRRVKAGLYSAYRLSK